MRRRKRPEKITFFVDRSLGSQIVPNALRQAGATVEIHDDHFSADEEDIVWLQEVGGRRWVVITCDSNIRRNYLEKLAVYKARVRVFGVFVLPRANYRGEDSAGILSAAIEKMERVARKEPPPFFAKVYKNGKVKMWIDKQTLADELGSPL